MNVTFFINTPAQYHFYTQIARELQKRGDEIFLLGRDYGETKYLFKEKEISFYQYSRPPKLKLGKILSTPFDVLNAYNYLKKLGIDLVSGFGGYEVYTSALLKVPSIVFTDSEYHVNRISYQTQFRLFQPLAEVIITPQAYRQHLGAKQIRVNSYKELAYLHPNYFSPDGDIGNLLNIDKGEEYVLLRFNAFYGLHDLGIGGFRDQDKIKLVHELEKYAKVFISSEVEVPDSIKDRVLKIPKSRIHDVIFHAKLLITDTQTMTTEAAILGTPAIRCNSFVGPNDMSNFIELEQKYVLIFNFSDPELAIQKAIELIQTPDLKQEWQKKRERLLKEKIDITAFMVWFVENYPESFRMMKERPEIQERFKIYETKY